MTRTVATPALQAPLSGIRPSIRLPVCFLVFTFLIGGGSRSDIISLPLLRGVAVFFAFWAAARLDASDWRRIRAPLVLLVAVTLWLAVQLIPLPPFMWQSLPGREVVAAVDALLGQSGIWRPISLTPSLTVNSLLGMSVPIAALLLAARMDPEDSSQFLTAIVAVACVSAVFGFLQILNGPATSLYFYRITNSDSMVGLFANRNHHSLFLACTVMIAAVLLRDEVMRKRKRRARISVLGVAVLFLTFATAFIGSRAGFAAGAVAFILGYLVVITTWNGVASPRRHVQSGPAITAHKLLKFAPPVLMAVSLALTVWFSSRVTSISRVATDSIAGDLRALAWPTVREMIQIYWPAGSGVGSFAEVYQIYEPDALLQPAYFNHAHNDWAEILITGGLPLALILLLTFVWIGRRMWELGTRNFLKGYRGDYRLLAATVLMILALGSLTDYPLRVPSLQVFAIMLIAMVFCPRLARQRGYEVADAYQPR